MKEIVNECVGCPPEMGCLGSTCPYVNVTRYYCDRCGEEIYPEELYRVEDDDLCESCLKDMFKTNPEEDE